jgi:PAS domain S-box-containing protein
MPRAQRSWKPSPPAVLGSAAAITVAAFCLLSVFLLKAQRDLQAVAHRNLRLDEVRGLILQLDAVRSSAARMGASTGNPMWEDVYAEYGPQLDAAIQDASLLAPESYTAEFNRKNAAANERLSALEQRAFALAREGHRDAAQRLLYGAGYQDSKAAYVQGLRDIQSVIIRQGQDALAAHKARMRLAFIALGLIVPALALAWYRLLHDLHATHEELLVGRERAEEKALSADARVRTIFEYAPVPIELLDLDGLQIAANPAAEELFGWSAAESAGRVPRSVPAEMAAELSATLGRLRSGEQLIGLESRRVRKGGEVLDVSISASVMRDAAGTPEAVLMILEDVTERRRLEVQLRQSQKMDAVGQLAGGIAHDFNNLLTVMLGCCELAEDELGDRETIREALKTVQQSGRRAAALTTQLLAFSRKQVLQPVVLDLNERLEEMEGLLRRLIGEGIELRTGYSRDLWRVKVDPNQIEQVLMNLALNARDAMPSGGKLAIESANVVLSEEYAADRVDVAPGPYAMFAVSDTGQGIDKAVLPRIFEPFFTTKEVGKGTGLGLSTVYGIVKQSRGHVAVYSEPGIGTTFKVYLPRVEEAAAPPSAAPALAAAPARGRETLLLVEDDESVRVLTRRMLEANGYTVLEAQDGERAFALFESHRGEIALLVTDAILPRNTGRHPRRRHQLPAQAFHPERAAREGPPRARRRQPGRLTSNRGFRRLRR